MNGAQLFERAARERPGDPGFLYFDTAISFGEAAAMARGLAASLRDELGLAPGDRVALMLQNVPQFAIAVHAAWLCGAVVTSVNPMNKEAELRHQLLDSGARLVICLESLYRVVVAAREGTAVEHVVTVSELDLLEQVPAALAGHERVECPGGDPLRRAARCRRRLRAGRGRGRLAGAADLHLGHDRAAEGGDQHPPCRRPQRRSDDRAGARSGPAT